MGLKTTPAASAGWPLAPKESPGYGTGANAIIDAQTARGLTAANALTQARLNASGLGGSTFSANQQANNTLNANLGAAQQKNEVRRQTTDRVLGARQDRVGTERALSSARTGLATGRAALFDTRDGQIPSSRTGHSRARS